MTSPAEDEIEIKLLAQTNAVFDGILALGSIGPFQLDRRPASDLTTTYLDTEDLDLTRAGIALRMRNSSGRWVLNIKRGGRIDGELHIRLEQSMQLDRPLTAPYPLPPGAIREQITAIAKDAPLHPLVVTGIRRQIVAVRDQTRAFVAEIALDTVRHGAPGAEWSESPSYYEIEVELVKGTPAILSEISALLGARWDLAPNPTSKFARALAEVRGITLAEILD